MEKGSEVLFVPKILERLTQAAAHGTGVERADKLPVTGSRSVVLRTSAWAERNTIR